MALNMFGLGISFEAFDNASAKMRSIGDAFKMLETIAGKSIAGLDQTVKGLGKGLVMTGTGAAMLGSSLNLAKPFAKVESGLIGVDIVSHATKQEMADLEKFVLDMAPKLGWKPEEALAGAEMLGQQSVGVADQLKMLPPLMKFAKAGQLEMADATSLAMQMLNMFELDMKLLPTVLDQAQGAADEFSMSTKDLVIGLSRTSGGAEMANATLTEVLGMFGLVKDVLKSTEISGTSVSYMLQSIIEKKNRILIKDKLGVDIFNQQTGQVRKMTDVFSELIPKLTAMTEMDRDDILSKIFGKEAAKGMVAMIARLNQGVTDAKGNLLHGAEGFRMALLKVAKQEGTLNRANDMRMNSYDGALSRMSASWDAFTSVLGKGFAAVWRPVFDGIQGMVDEWKVALQGMAPETQKMIAMVWTIAGALLTVAGTAAMIKPLFLLFKYGFSLISNGFAAVGLAGWPLLVVLGLVATVLYGIENNIGGMRDKAMNFFTGLGGFVMGLVDLVWGTIQGLAAGFWTVFRPIANIFTVIFADILDTIGDIFSALTAGGGLITFFKVLYAAIGGILGLVADGIGVFVNVFAGILWIVAKVFWVVAEIVKFLFEKLGSIGHMFYAIVPKAWRNDDRPIKKKDELANAVKPESVMSTMPAQPATPWQSSSGDIMSSAPPSGLTPAEYRGLMSRQPTQPMSAVMPSAGASVAQMESHASAFGGLNPPLTSNQFDYDRLAAAMAKQPMTISLDGQKIVAYVNRANADVKNRESRL